MDKIFNVVASGRAYTDVIAKVTPEFLGRYGLTPNSDRRVNIEELREIQSHLLEPKMFAGGPSANTMATIAALGGTAGYFGKVNNDEVGRIFLADFQSRGVTLCSEPYDKTVGLSPTCLVLTTHERAFAYNPGCADFFQSDDFNKFDFSTTDFFLIEAFLLTSQQCGSVIEQAAVLAKSCKARIAFNLQSHTIWQDHRPTLDAVIKLADVILGNSEEVGVFRERLQMPIPHNTTIVTTDGSKGVTAYRGDMAIHVDAIPISMIVNTNGAGDALAAGFLLGQSNEFTIAESLRLGVLAAKEALSETGARPTRSLKHLMQLCRG